MSEQKLNLYQKISLVMQDVSYLQKDGKVEFKTTKYKAISEEKVTTAVREALIKHGLVILPIEQKHTKEGTLTAVDTKYKIIDIDTGENEIIVSSGTGADTQDKGVGKAMTYSYKYLLLRTFAIPTGEDPDKISSAELDEATEKERTRKLEPITSKQLGEIKTKVLEFASLYDKSPDEVYTWLNITNLEQLTIGQAEHSIVELDKWIGKKK